MRSRESLALARRVELATGDGRNGDGTFEAEKTAELPQTSDTESQTTGTEAAASAVGDQHGGTA
jgi:hypothetical protein